MSKARQIFDSVISYDSNTSVNKLLLPTQQPVIKSPDPIDYTKNMWGGRADRRGGAIANQIAQFVASGVNAISIGDTCSLVLKSGGPSRHAYVSAAEFLNDVRIAVQNTASKGVESAVAEPTLPLEIDLLVRTIGIWCHVANSLLNSDLRPYELILESTSMAETIVYEVYPTQAQQQFMILIAANNGGIGLIQSLDDVLITVPEDELAEGTVFSVQSINARDIM
jgi:hypothetical protein